MGFNVPAIVSSILRPALPLIALAMLFGCTESDHWQMGPADTWYRPIDNPLHEFVALPPFLYSPVKGELIDEAAAAMGDGPLLQLSPSEAVRYAEHRLQTMRELRPFLIHGLYRSERVFTVYIADRALWVDSHDETAELAAARRQPLVVYIDEVPPDVYVTIGAAHAAVERAAVEVNAAN